MAYKMRFHNAKVFYTVTVLLCSFQVTFDDFEATFLMKGIFFDQVAVAFWVAFLCIPMLVDNWGVTHFLHFELHEELADVGPYLRYAFVAACHLLQNRIQTLLLFFTHSRYLMSIYVKAYFITTLSLITK